MTDMVLNAQIKVLAVGQSLTSSVLSPGPALLSELPSAPFIPLACS